MGRQIHKLSAITANRIKEQGRYSDGGGLYLQVSSTGTKAWLFRFMLDRRPRSMGLGSFNIISLAEARIKALACRKLLLDGIDPIERRLESRIGALTEFTKSITFDECASTFIKNKSAEWTNEKHKAQWTNTLNDFASPVIGSVSIQKIETALIIKILEPIWRHKTETAKRVQGRIEAVIDWASARGFRSGDNPARWRGHLDKLLPAPRKITPVQHHASLSYLEVGKFCIDLREKVSLTSTALELMVLSVLRPGELVGARWSEVDLESRIWTVPANRMKKKIEHRIPLSPPAHELLISLKSFAISQFIFPGFKGNPHMTTASLLNLVKDMRPDLNLTSHGFRATFKTWATECTNFPSDVVEMAIAHKISDKVQAAYQRGDLFSKRTKLMAAWAEHCSKDHKMGRVIELGSKQA